MSLYEILNKENKITLYKKTYNVVKETEMKVVFNILNESHLLTQLDNIKNYPNDFEVTTPVSKKEFDARAGKIIKEI